jgi:hypothetical protein
MTISGATYREGIAYNADGAMYVAVQSGGSISSPTISNPTITGTVTSTANIKTVLLSSGIPFIHISSGSMGNNGALSGVTALAVTYSKGAYIYLPANAIQAGSGAGWYFAIFSSTTAATVYNNTYTSGIPAIPSAPTAFVTTGPGAYTGDTTLRTALDITLPAGAMGPNGSLRVRCVTSSTNTAGARTNFAVKLGGAGGTSHLTNTTVSSLGVTGEVVIHNVGAQDAQSSQTAVNASSGALIRSTIDTSASTTIVIQEGKTGAATDNVVLENYSIELAYGA